MTTDTNPRSTPGSGGVRRFLRTAGPALLIALLTAQTSASGCASQPSTAGQDAESAATEFAGYDITESGWLSGTELDACNCRQYDSDGDGEVTRAEFVAGRTGAATPAAPAAQARATPAATPAAPAAQARATPAATPQPQQPTTARQSTQLEVGAEVEAYISFAWRPATLVQIGGGPSAESPYKVTNGPPISGRQAYMWLGPDNIRLPSRPASGPASGPRVGSYYVLSYGSASQPPLQLGRLEILAGGRYRYSNAGTTGAGTFTYSQGMVRWQGGPFAEYGWRGEFTVERDGKTHKIRLNNSTIATNSID